MNEIKINYKEFCDNFISLENTLLINGYILTEEDKETIKNKNTNNFIEHIKNVRQEFLCKN